MRKLKPDDFLDLTQFDEINAGFYVAEPADYFRLRIEMLLLTMARRTDVAALLAEGVEWHNVSLTPKSHKSEELGDEEVARRMEAVGIADAEVIYHHVVECLLRLTLAHLRLPACPQLEMARLRGPGEFKRRVTSGLLEREAASLADDLWPVFYGGDDLIACLNPTPAQGEIAGAKIGVARWMQRFALTWLERAPIYNAAKHGFAISAGDGAVSLAAVGPSTIALSREGPVISYLGEQRVDDGRRWAHFMSFTEPDASLGAAHLACDLVDQLWSIAHHRYVGTPRRTTIHLFRDDLDAFDAERAKKLGPYQVTSMVTPLRYGPERPEPAG
jgi:hypothetical protein